MGYGKAAGTGIMPTRAAMRTPEKNGRHGRNDMLRRMAWFRTGACIRRPLEIIKADPHISEFVHFIVKVRLIFIISEFVHFIVKVMKNRYLFFRNSEKS